MGKLIYHLFIRLYPFALKIASVFNEKAALWINGRKEIMWKIKEALRGQDKIIWMHCSSLGEFEQGRPLLEKLKIDYPSNKILLTFFSPSGFEVRKSYAGADFIFYLPMDSPGNAKTFFDIVSPQLIIFVKYEFWHYYLHEAKERGIPLLLISAIFRSEQPFFSKHGKFHRNMLSCFTHLFVQNKESVNLLNGIGFNKNVSISGDTRFDRVIEIAENFEAIPLIESFCANSAVIVAGSTWLEDDKKMANFVNERQDIKFIIAPHDISKNRLEECKRLYKHSALFSSLQSSQPTSTINTIIIDNIGILSKLYKYATTCFIGGGFGADGVHNVLEAAVYGKPVVFGPQYEKFDEAVEIIKTGGGISIKNGLELKAIFEELLQNAILLKLKENASLQYVYNQQGATKRILDYIYENRLLTS